MFIVYSLYTFRYPARAPFPQAVHIGFTMGANAETDLNLSGFFNAHTSAPCPPIECPVMPEHSSTSRPKWDYRAGVLYDLRQKCEGKVHLGRIKDIKEVV